MKSILVATNEEEAYPLIASTYKSGFSVERTASRTEALELLQTKRFDLIFIDLDVLNNRDSEDNFKESLKPFWQLFPSVEIIVMTRQDKIRKAVNAVKAGADDYLTYPLDAVILLIKFHNRRHYHVQDHTGAGGYGRRCGGYNWADGQSGRGRKHQDG